MQRWLCALAALPVISHAQSVVHTCVQADGVRLFTDQSCGMTQGNLTLSVSAYAGYPTRLQDVAPFWHEQVQPLLVGIHLLPLLAAIYGLMSLICFAAYYRDKQFAIKKQQRTPEARLHLYEVLGGWPGGLLAQRLIRHKNRKLSYQLVFWLIVLLHAALAGLLLWLINLPA